MKCKLCGGKKSPNSRRLTWDLWQICVGCYSNIKKSNIVVKGLGRVRVNYKTSYCLFDLKTVTSTTQGGMPFCNSACRSKFYRRELTKQKGIEWWNRMVEKNTPIITVRGKCFAGRKS